MKKKLCLLIFCLFLGLFTDKSNAVQTEDYFPMNVGNRWVYQTRITVNEKFLDAEMESRIVGTQEIDGVQTYVFNSSIGGKLSQKDYYEKNQQGVFHHRSFSGGVLSDIKPALKLMEFPVQTGQSWTWDGVVGGITGKFEVAVLSQEKITVKAGTFQTYKIKMEGKKEDDSTISSTYWCAPNVGTVKQEITTVERGVTINITAELESYTLKK